jgi:AcrR family transcriptional regulator
MRVTAEAKETTRQTILDVARDFLRDGRWEGASTRDLAAAAEIGNGTLFNYFPNKEAIVADIVADELEGVRCEEKGSVEERIFAFIAAGLRKLKPYRTILRATDIDKTRDDHIAEVESVTGELQPVQRHLYWSLYSGVVNFWADDDSPKQEQTLALLDQSVALFLASLKRNSYERRPAAAPDRASSSRRRPR